MKNILFIISLSIILFSCSNEIRGKYNYQATDKPINELIGDPSSLKSFEFRDDHYVVLDLNGESKGANYYIKDKQIIISDGLFTLNIDDNNTLFWTLTGAVYKKQ